MWILASAMAFSAVEFVRMPLASVRTQTLPVSQPAEQRWQPAVVLLQSSSPLFTVRGAVRPRHVAGKAPPASAAAWLWPSALLAATLVTRVGRTASSFSGHILRTNSSTLKRARQKTPTHDIECIEYDFQGPECNLDKTDDVRVVRVRVGAPPIASALATPKAGWIMELHSSGVISDRVKATVSAFTEDQARALWKGIEKLKADWKMEKADLRTFMSNSVALVISREADGPPFSQKATAF